MVIVGPPNPEKERPPQPRKPEVNLTFLESLPDWRLFSRFGELPKGHLRQAAIFYWLLTVGILGLLILAFTIGDKPKTIDRIIPPLIAAFLIVTLVYWSIARITLWVSDLMQKKSLIQKKSNRFSQMHKGVRRILYCLNFIVVVTVLILVFNNINAPQENAVAVGLLILFFTLVGITALFWGLVRICLWILDGFKEEKEKKLKGTNQS